MTLINWLMITQLVVYEILWRFGGFGVLWEGGFLLETLVAVFFPSGKFWSEGRNEGGEADDSVWGSDVDNSEPRVYGLAITCHLNLRLNRLKVSCLRWWNHGGDVKVLVFVEVDTKVFFCENFVKLKETSVDRYLSIHCIHGFPKDKCKCSPFERFLGFSGFSPGDAGDAEGWRSAVAGYSGW